MRKLSFIPAHFKTIELESFYDFIMIDYWINYNLNGRYAIKRDFSLDTNNKLVEVTKIGLEDPKELLMLTLGCPYIHNKEL